MATRSQTIPPARRQFISTERAAERLDVTRRTVLKAINDGHLRAYRVGHLIKLDVADVDALAVPVVPGTVGVA